MPTVKSTETGEEIEIIQVCAVAALSAVSQVNTELPDNASKVIEQAMSGAVTACMEEGISDPVVIRERMLEARASVKRAMRNHMIDLMSQKAAEQQQE